MDRDEIRDLRDWLFNQHADAARLVGYAVHHYLTDWTAGECLAVMRSVAYMMSIQWGDLDNRNKNLFKFWRQLEREEKTNEL